MSGPEQALLFSGAEWLRYTRHLQLPGFGAGGQSALKRARVLIVGCGGLGAPVALYLAAAGVGRITLLDGDRVDLANLQRQIAFATADVGQAKAECARRRLLALNPEIEVAAVAQYLHPGNAGDLVAAADLVVDCSDNFATRYLINDACVGARRPWLYASIHQFSGQAALFMPGQACFRCVFPEPPEQAPDCNTAGVLGVLPGLLGCLQASEAIALLAGLEPALANRMALFDARTLTLRKLALTPSRDCACRAAAGSVPLPAAPPQAACAAADGAADGAGLGVEAFLEAMTRPGACLVDVRGLDERRGFHVGGIHIALEQLPQRLHELPRDGAILLYCQSGARSARAAELLLRAGFGRVQHLSGGLLALLRSGADWQR